MTGEETSSRVWSAVFRLVGRIVAFAPIWLAAVAGVAIWLIFRPGFLDADGMGQLGLATRGVYNDWFSPLMIVAFVWSMKAGSDIGAVTLIQAVFGAVGVYAMAAEVIRYLYRDQRPDWQIRWSALAVLAVLLTPFTPLMYYLAHFRNDSLAAFFLAWALAGWFRVDRAWNRESARLTPLRKLGLLMPPALFTILTIMIRYNAVVILPWLLILVALILGRTSRRTAAAMITVLLVAPTVLHECLLRVTHAERTHPERQIMGIELVGICVENDEVRAKYLPYTSKHLLPDRFPQKYVPGCVWSVIPGAPEYWIVDPTYLSNFKRLRAEFRRAIRLAPLTWLSVKGKAAAASLFDQAPHWHHRVIDPNTLGIAFRDELRPVRYLLLDIDSAIFSDPVLRFLCARHLPWLILDICLVIFAGIAAFLTRSRRSAMIVVVLMVPLAYYISHMLAVAAHDYRYMFPATLLLQVFMACGAIRMVARRMEAHVANTVHEQGHQSMAATGILHGPIKRGAMNASLPRDR